MMIATVKVATGEVVIILVDATIQQFSDRLVIRGVNAAGEVEEITVLWGWGHVVELRAALG